MRFQRLTLSAFGHFTDRTLEFGDGKPDFHILFGPNEAGKSTTLAAIADLLFGIEKFSRYRFLHDNALYLAATVTGADGTSLNFRRRKGDKNTLLDETGSPMDETRLAALRGPADRAFFTGMFGLDHVRLRQGGEEIHSAKGDLGQSLFQAGAAIRDLHAVLGRLDSEAGQLFSPQGRNPRINAGISQYKESRALMTKAALKGDAWTQMRDEAARLEARLGDIRLARAALEGQRSKLERIRRVLPLLARHHDLTSELAELAAVPLLPADAARQRRDAQDSQSRHRHALRDAADLLDRLSERAAQVSVDPALLPLHGAIARLQQQHGAIVKALADLPARRGERTLLTAQMANALRELGRDMAPQHIRSILPDRPAVAKIRALMTEDAELSAVIRQTKANVDSTQSRIARLEAELAQVPLGVDPQPLKEVLKDLSRHGQCDDLLRAAEAELDRHSRAIAADLAKLPLWSGDAAGLVQLSLPSLAQLRGTDDAQRKAAQRVHETGAQLKACRAEQQRCAAELAGLSVAGEPATEALVSAARRQRDEGWRLIRRRFADNAPVDAASADAYEQDVTAADSLADRVKGEAQRVTRLEEATKQQRLADARAATAETEAEQAAQDLTKANQDWAVLWQASGIAPGQPATMLDFLDGRAKLLTKLDQQQVAQAEVTRLRQIVADGRQKLMAALGQDNTGLDFAALLARAADLSQSLDHNAATRRSLNERLSIDRADAQSAGLRHQAAVAALEDWRQRWAIAVQPLGLAASAGTAEVEAVLTILDTLADLLRQSDSLDHRITAMEKDVAAFDDEIASLVAMVAADLMGRPPLDALSTLAARVESARNSDRMARELAEQITAAHDTQHAATTGLAEAEIVLGHLCRQAGCITPEDLEEVERRSARRQQVEQDKAAQERLLLDNGDGLGLAELASEAAAMDRDLITATSAEINDQLAQLDQERETLRDALTRQQDAQKAMDGDSATALAAQESEKLATEIRDDASQYIRLRLGHAVLRQAVELYRQRHQGPLMARAAELFRRLTLDNFAGLDTGFDKNDQPILLARRDDGKAVEIAGLSEGTSDQLFLALRLAAVEQHLASGRRLPFIADDLLIHFDDDRAIAALSVLAELATKTQVLFFTHNRHMVELARQNLAEPTLRFMSL